MSHGVRLRSGLTCLLCLLSLCWNAQAASFERHYQEALLLMQEGRFVDARQELEQSVRDNASSDAYFALGVSCFQLHQLEAARSAYQEALRLLPPAELAARIRGGLGDVYFENGDYARAVSAYRQVLENHDWPGVRLKLATAYLRLYRYSDALQESETLMQQTSPLAETHYLRSLIYLARKNWDAALDELNQLSRYPEHQQEAYQHLNWLYRLQGRYDEAMQMATELAEHNTQQDPAIYRLAAETGLEALQVCLPAPDCLTPQRLAPTQKYLERWLLIAPHQAQAYFIWGQWEQLQGHFAAALQDYQEAANGFPERLDYNLKLALLYQSLQNPKQALALLQAIPPERSKEEALWQEMPKWFSIYPQLPQRWLTNLAQTDLPPLLKGRYLFWKGYFLWQTEGPSKGVQELWQKAEKHLKQEPEGLMIQALRLWQAAEKDWAARLLQQIHQQRPNWWLPEVYLGRYYLETEPTEAQKWLQAAYRQNPADLSLALDLLKTYPQGPSQQALLRQLLQSFPDERKLQELYLEEIGH